MTPLRIAVLTATFPRAAETPFTNILAGLARRGHRLDIFADRAEQGTAPHPMIVETGLLERTVHRPRFPGGAAGLLAALRTVRRHPEAPWLRRALDPTRFGPRALRGDSVAEAAPLVGRGPWDVVYATYGQLGLDAVRLRRIGAFDAPVVTAFRGADITQFPQRRGPGAYDELFRDGELFLPVCRALADRARALGAPPDRTRVHGTGLDLSLYAWRARRPGAGDGTTWLVTAARLVAKKGLDDTLRAVRRLRDAGHDVRFRLLGDGPLREPLERLVAELRLEPAVEFLGQCDAVTVRAAMAASDIAALCSVTSDTGDAEGIPNMLKEAMLVGLPVVATLHSGIPELVEHGVSGYLVPEREPAAIAAAVERLVSERARWAEMGAAGRRVVERDYDIEVLNDRLV
ncbi:MAG: glycosyltransferase, partial [Gemmatimonadales bacterium]|nr:glycosyltransferase [Gemmatimonadales bacterium]